MRIMLVCSAGMSTSMLVKKMQEVAETDGLQAEIFAVAESEAKNHTDVNVVLLGPQVRFLQKKIQEAMTDIPVDVINSIHYGTLNGKAVLDHAMSIARSL